MDFEINLFVTAIFLGIACSYVTKCLLLEPKDGHEGPFKLKKIFILFPGEFSDDDHIQQATLFDLIRYLFGVYTRSEESNDFQTIWVVHPERSERFTCPFCLSFWVATLFTLAFWSVYQFNLLEVIAVHLIVSVFSTLFIGAMNYAMRV